MKSLPAVRLDIFPDLDMETYMFLSQSENIDGAQILSILPLWEKWSKYLNVYRLGEKKGYLLVYLEDEVAQEVDELWQQSASEGFKHEAIAQTMIMSTIKTILPQISEKGCAPVPKPSKVLKRSLDKIGIGYNNGLLDRKYATLTHYPPKKDGCEVCMMKDTCPKKMNLFR